MWHLHGVQVAVVRAIRAKEWMGLGKKLTGEIMYSYEPRMGGCAQAVSLSTDM